MNLLCKCEIPQIYFDFFKDFYEKHFLSFHQIESLRTP